MPISAIGNEAVRGAPRCVAMSGGHSGRFIRSRNGPSSTFGCGDRGFTPLWRSAEHGFTPLWRSAEHGFTLIELLVTLFIIALLSAAVIAALPDPGGGLTVEAERFAARVRAAQERAVMDNRSISIRVDEAGYAFEWSEAGEWRPIGRRPFDSRGWQQGTTAEVAGTDRIQFDSTGFAEARNIVLIRDRDRVVVEIANGGDVHVRP